MLERDPIILERASLIMPENKNIKKPKKLPPLPKAAPTKKPLLFSVSIKEKVFLAKHLAIMIQAGIPIREALRSLLEEAPTPSLRYLLDTCVTDIEGGQVLAYCLVKFPRVFDPFFSNVISVGEQSGTLAESLGYLSTQLEKTRELNGKVRAALIYPIIVFAGAIGIGTYLSFFLLPKLIPLFISLGTKLPATTQLLLSFTNGVRLHGKIILVAVAVATAGFVALWRVKKIKYIIHTLFIWFPLFGTMVTQVQTTQFARILGTLLTAGVKVVPALRIAANSMSNLVYQKELTEVADQVERGESMAQELKIRRRLFNLTAISMVRVGEETGKLSESLLSLANFTEAEVDNDIKNLTSLIEPLVLVFVGVLVGFVALSIISPIYQLTQSVSQ